MFFLLFYFRRKHNKNSKTKLTTRASNYVFFAEIQNTKWINKTLTSTSVRTKPALLHHSDFHFTSEVLMEVFVAALCPWWVAGSARGYAFLNQSCETMSPIGWISILAKLKPWQAKILASQNQNMPKYG
jgi:hypothetical protein